MVLHSDWEDNDYIWRLQCHCIQTLHSEIYTAVNWYFKSDLQLGLSRPFPLEEMEEIVLKALGGSLYLRVDQKDIFPLHDLASGPTSLLIATFSSTHTIGCSKKTFLFSDIIWI